MLPGPFCDRTAKPFFASTQVSNCTPRWTFRTIDIKRAFTKVSSPNLILLNVGIYVVPVKNLTSPSVNRLIRIPDDTFVSTLKAEMLRNRTNEVAPIIGLLELKEGEVFNKDKCDTYVYECIGGNHSRLAHQQILEDNPDLNTDRHFSHRSVSIYVNLTDEQAQHLAHRHNRTTEFINVMTTQDKVT